MKKSGVYFIESTRCKSGYVGSTINITSRFSQHRATLNNNTHDNVNIQSFFNQHGKNFLRYVVLEECELEILKNREQYWMDYFKSQGYNLFNIAPNAESCIGLKLTDEQKKAISERQKGVPKSDKLKSKWRDGRRKGRPKSDYFKASMSEKMKGNKNGAGVVFTQERKKTISEASKKANTGKKHSEEHKKKISENSPFKGIVRTEEYKAKMSVLVREAKAKKKEERLKSKNE